MTLTKATYSMIEGAPVNVLDYGAVSDGVTDNTSALQAAINAAIASGETLYFPAGTYLTGKLTLSGSIRMTGAATLKLKSATNDHLLQNNSGGAINVDVRDMTFDGDYANQTAWTSLLNFAETDYITFSGCNVLNVFGAGLDTNPLNQRALIEGCRFEGNRDHSGVLNENPLFLSIRCSVTSDPQLVTVNDCMFIGEVPAVSNAGAGGVIVTTNSGGTNKQGAKCTITNNTFYNCGQNIGGNAVAAITLYRAAPYSQVCNNRILTTYEKGIDVQSSYSPIITGNYLENIDTVGIALALREGVYCENGVIANNVIDGAGDIGIAVFSGPPLPASDSNNVVISDNIVKNVDRFLLVDDYLGAISITGNVFVNSSSTGSIGSSCISVIGAKGAGVTYVEGEVLFANNIIETFTSTIYFSEWARPVNITGNIIFDNDTSTALVAIYNEADVNITGNQFKNCLGFVIAQLCEATVNISSNAFNNSLTTIRGVQLIDLDAATLTVVNGNTFKDCDNNIVNYDNALGRNLCVNNVSDAGRSIRIVAPSAVTQANNLFV